MDVCVGIGIDAAYLAATIETLPAQPAINQRWTTLLEN